MRPSSARPVRSFGDPRSALSTAILLAAAACVALGPGPARAQTERDTSYSHLGRVLDRILLEQDWGGGRVSMVAGDLRHGIPVLDHESATPHPPGPILQIATAMTALELLGPEFRFHTTLEIAGRLERGTLRGAIRVRSDGDPTITSAIHRDPDLAYEAFDRWATLLRARGIRRLEGSLLVDAAAFEPEPYPPGWPEDAIGGPELPEISALNFNDNCVDIHWKPARRAGGIAAYDVFPPIKEKLFVSNNVRVMGPPLPSERTFARRPDSGVIQIGGRIRPGESLVERASIHDPALFFGEALKERLGRKGVKIDGEVVAYDEEKVRRELVEIRVREMESRAEAAESFEDAAAPEPSTPGGSAAGGGPTAEPGADDDTRRILPEAFERLDEWTSPPLRDIVRNMLAKDRALDAEVILRTLGARESGARGSTARGVEVLRGHLQLRRIPSSGMALLDGSGRSSLDRMTARQAYALLEWMFGSGFGRDVAAGFSVAGDPGSLERRFRVPLATVEAGAEGAAGEGAADETPGAAAQAGKDSTEKPAPGKATTGAKGANAKGAPPPSLEVPMVLAWPEPRVAAIAGGFPGGLSIAGWALTEGGYPIHFALLVSGSDAPAEDIERAADAVVVAITRAKMR